MVLLKVMLSKQVLPKPVLPHVEKLNSTNESETLQGKGWSREKKPGAADQSGNLEHWFRGCAVGTRP